MRLSEQTSAADTIIARLAAHGVDYLFANAGTDFPPLIEALAKAAAHGTPAPRAVAVPHENLAVAMAHGYYHATGRPQAVMVHVNVGTANALCGLFNAARDQVPLLLFAGRTPYSDGATPGSRSVFIHWAQEMFDQAGLVRETVKWEAELHLPEQAATLVDRAFDIAMSAPRGPVYLALPREILAQHTGTPAPPLRGGAATEADADPQAVAQLSAWLLRAEHPLLITAGLGRDPADVTALTRFATDCGVPVVCYRPRYLGLPTDHPMHYGFEPGPHLPQADLVLVVDCDVPWIPKLHRLHPKARVVHIGHDPHYSRYPVRSFPSDLSITSNPRRLLERLCGELTGTESDRRFAARRTRLARQSTEPPTVANPGTNPSTPHWVAHCLNAAKSPEDLVVTETILPMELLRFTVPGTHFGTSPAGALGWALGESIGLKLGQPGRRVIAVVGDGTYLFGNPTPAHHLCEALKLPVLTLILNNHMWGAVRRATLAMYPNGFAAATPEQPLTMLQPSPRFEQIVAACGGYGEAVTCGADLPGALQRALHAVDVERRQAVLNVYCRFDDVRAAQDAQK